MGRWLHVNLKYNRAQIIGILIDPNDLGLTPEYNVISLKEFKWKGHMIQFILDKFHFESIGNLVPDSKGSQKAS